MMRRCWGILLIAVAVGLAIVSRTAVSAENPTTPANQRSLERNRLWRSAQQLAANKKTAEAIQVGEQILEIERSLYGESPLRLAPTLKWLETQFFSQSDLGRAEKYAAEQLRIYEKHRGRDHWQSVSARFQLDYLQRLGKLSDEPRQQLLAVTTDCVRLMADEDFPAALQKLEQARGLELVVLGAEHPVFSTTLANLGQTLWRLERFAESEVPLREALKIRVKSYEELHPQSADLLRMLALVLEAQGKFAAAEETYWRYVEALQNLKEREPNSLEITPLAGLTPKPNSNGPDLLTIRQYRLLLARDLEIQQAATAMLALNWSAGLTAAQKAQSLELEAFGSDFAGDPTTMTILLFCHLQLGELESALPVFERLNVPSDAVAGFAVFFQANQSRSLLLKILTQSIEVGAFTGFNAPALSSQRVEKLTAYRELWHKAGFLEQVPPVSLALALAHAEQKNWEQSLLMAQEAYRHARWLAGKDWKNNQQPLGIFQTGPTPIAAGRSLAEMLVNCASDHEQAGRWEESVAVRTEMLRIATDVYDDPSPARRGLERTQRIAKLSEQDRQKLANADTEMTTLWTAVGERRHRDAMKQAQRALQVYEQFLGKESDNYGFSLKVNGFLHWTQGEYGTAFDRLTEAARILLKTRGKLDQTTQGAIKDVFINAQLHIREAPNPVEFTAKVRAFEELIDKAYGADHTLTASAQACRLHVDRIAQLNDSELAKLRQQAAAQKQRNAMFQRGQFEQAIPLAQQIVTEFEAILGERDPEFHQALSSLANIQNQAGQSDEAKKTYQRLVELSDRAPFNRLQGFGSRLHWYGSLLQDRGESDEALKVLSRAKQVIEQISGRNQEYAYALRIEGRVYQKSRGQPALAYPGYVEATAILREELGTSHYEYAQVLTDGSETERKLGFFDAAESHLKEALAIRERLTSSDPTQLAWNLNNLGLVYLSTDRFDLAIETFQKVIEIKEGLNNKAQDLAMVYANLIRSIVEKGDEPAAADWINTFHTSRQKAWGADDPRYADDLISLGSELMSHRTGFVFVNVSDQRAALIEPLLHRAADIRRKDFGESSWQYAEVLRLQGALMYSSGRNQRAIELLLEARAAAEAVGETRSSLYGSIWGSLAVAYSQRGDFARSLPAQQQALEVIRKANGEQSPAYANNLLRLGTLASAVGDFDRAEDAFRRAGEIFVAIGQDRRIDCFRGLATNFLRMNDLDRAEQFLHYVVQLEKLSQSTEAKQDYRSQLALMRLYLARGQVDEAWLVAQQTTARAATDNGGHVPSAEIAELSGRVLLQRGQLEEAETKLKQAVAKRERQWGADYHGNVEGYAALALVAERRGDLMQAADWRLRAVTLAIRQWELVSAAQSERQQLALRALVARQIDDYLSFALRTKQPATKVYSVLLPWKGAVFTLQQDLHTAQQTTDAESRKLLGELTTINRELAIVTFDRPTGSRVAWANKLKDLSERKERLEGLLSQHSAEFRTRHRRRELTPEELQKVLPPNVALVDFVQFQQRVDPTNVIEPPRTHWLAFVVSRDQPVKLFDLGDAEPIERDIQEWRAVIGRRGDPRQTEIGKRLRDSLWTPVEPSLAKAQTVLVSPDGNLAQLPFAALPGKKRGAFLLEEVGIVIVPVPQLIPESLAVVATDKPPLGKPVSASMLLLGDVNFDQARHQSAIAPSDSKTLVGVSAKHSGVSRFDWPRLPGTAAEVDAVRKTLTKYRSDVQVESLIEGTATESAVRQHAAQARWLHLATHGFFAGSSRTSDKQATDTDSLESSVLGRDSVPGFHPGLLSGLVLAGANQPTEIGQDDGILTAIEVSELDLRNVELTVLSACETGLGELNSGEGVLGLQRAFQIAGSRTVVASLWKVDDRATQVLMDEFYRNLWERKLGKLEALRQAQLAMLQRYDLATGELRGTVVKLKPMETNPAAADRSQGLPAAYWAAFLISGDWR